eukprot:scaffold2205_cov183-Ochromonas_danica.AAC.10
MTTGLVAVEHFNAKFAAWTLFFSLVYVLAYYLPRLFWESWFKTLPSRKRSEWPSYIISSLHHCIMVPLAWNNILQDFRRGEQELAQVDYAVTEGWIAPISMGYLLADTLCYAIPQLVIAGQWEFMIHHGFTLWFVAYCLMIPGHILRYIPHFLVCDTTNIIFNLCWFLRLTEWKESALVMYLELTFALMFFLLRNVNMTMVIVMFWWHGFNQLLGWTAYLILPIGLLQWYWITKIVLSATTRYNPPKHKTT